MTCWASFLARIRVLYRPMLPPQENQTSQSPGSSCARPPSSQAPARYLVVTSIDPVSFLLGSLIS